MALTRATDKIIANADGNLNLSGIVTATSFVGSGTALTGIDAATLKFGNSTKAEANNSGVVVTGVLTATSYSGDGSNLTNLPAGLGTALSSDQTSPLNKLYYTNEILSIGSTVTVDHPVTGTGAYTQYADIRLEEDADLIIEDGDDVIPDILGLGTDGSGLGAGGSGRIRVDSITNKNANGAPNFTNGVTGTAATFTNSSTIAGIVTLTSGGVDTVGVVTASSFDGSLNASQITSGSIPSARITQGSVTQYVTPFDDDKIINDISALALKVSALENSTASNTNSTFVDTYQDSAGISTITNAARSTTGEFVASVFDTVVTYQFDQAGTHGQPGILRMNSGMGAPVTGYWAEERTAETGGYIQASVNFAFDLSGDFTHFFYHKVGGSGGATSVAYPNAGAIISPKTTITTGKNPTYNGSTIWDIDLSANQAEASGGSFSPDQIEDQIFTSDVETHLGISGLPGGNQTTGTTQVNINYASVSNADGYHFGKYMNSGSNRHGVKYTYTKSNNTMLAEFTQDGAGAVHGDGRVTITNLPTAGRVFLFYGNANGGGSSTQYIGMKTNASGVGVSNGTFTTLTSSATGSYQSTTINAAATTSKMGVVITYVDQSGTTTLNTDLKVFLSANNGTNYTQVTLVAQPNFATGVKMAKANDVTISNTGTQLKYKIEFANQALGSKETRVTGVSLQY